MWRLAAFVVFLASSLDVVQDDGLRAEFQHLWNMVVINQQSRNVSQGEAPAIRRACQFGVSTATFDVADWMLSFADPPLEELEIIDVLDSGEGMLALASELQRRFGRRVRLAGGHGKWQRPPLPMSQTEQENGDICDLVLFSKVSTRFTLERIMDRVGSHVVTIWASDECISETTEVASPACAHLNTFWERTYLMMRGYCLGRICASRVLKSILQDPNVLELRCDEFRTEQGSNASISEFGQDWFILRNFLGLDAKGIYVDVGASLPFDYSNTVMLDRCLGWQGLCVEPNPQLSFILEAYRSCQVFTNCVDEAGLTGRPFADRDGKVEFHADCLTLTEILREGGLSGRRIDLLSIDVEHQELAVLRGLSFEEFDIRIIVVEVTRGARWLEVDSILLPKGYAKVAVLGRDVVYVRLEELQHQGDDWPLFGKLGSAKATLPPGWAEFHQRVLDEEMEEEMRQERHAFYAGLRRTKPAPLDPA
ncbi:unnamed protein product [Symbiodinium necroappetens]|uniref:Methyltransferase FkbM domain-containing protein n=1 Tax=Symbiodinium necroappetens TaxID=1628268 RepID=A0A813AR05_9DINO|nr:unnamed protein product [Symbiodinium necroappetens]